MCVETLTVKSNIRNYQVLFESNTGFISKLASLQNAVYIIDANVWQNYGKDILSQLPSDRIILQEAREEYKNIDTVCELYEKIMHFAPRKNMNLVSFGGGIIQDITGFVASTLYRGINWIFVPTTLLSQVDSCIGAKTSLNFKHFKNLVGSFYPPSKIYLFPNFVQTLKREDFYSGVGEMAKLHLMDGEKSTEEFIESLPKIDAYDNQTLLKMVHNCLRIKKDYIENDEFDTGRRNLLNYGHCFGHAIESATDFAISHGQAVVIGMILANMYSAKVGYLSANLEKFVRNEVLEPSLVVSIPKWDNVQIMQAMRQDKKNVGNGLALVMLTDNYQMKKITDLSENSVISLLDEFNEQGGI